MTIERINPEELARPSGFSHAVRTSGRATVHLAGQTALDRDGRIVGSTVVEQFGQALRNLVCALTAAGGAPADLVSLTIYTVDIAAYRERAREVGSVWREVMGAVYPATAAVEVGRLWDVEALVELQGVAAVDTV